MCRDACVILGDPGAHRTPDEGLRPAMRRCVRAVELLVHFCRRSTMPVSIVRRYAPQALVAATGLAIVVAIAPYVVTAATPVVALPVGPGAAGRTAMQPEAIRVELVPGG